MQLRKVSPAYAVARYPDSVHVKDLPLRNGELLVEFKVLKDATLVWMIGPSEVGTTVRAFYKVDRPRDWWEHRILTIRDAFNSGHPEQCDPRTSEEIVGSLFPKPFADNLEKADAIIFISDDVLFLMPFEMLSPHATRGQYSLLNTPTEYFPSAASFRLVRNAVRHQSDWDRQFIGIADPITSPDDERYVAAAVLTSTKPAQRDSGQTEAPTYRGLSVDRIRAGGFVLERLPGTADEVKSVASLFSLNEATTEVRTGKDATKQQLMQTDLDRFRFVHFATHGVLPVESGIKEPALVLSYQGGSKDDMLLTLSDVLKMKLHADMVVLSACNTGSGKVSRAEGVASLGTAFLAAGASSATVSLWQVSDTSTSIFVQEFYRNLLKGIPKGASLAAARASLVRQGYDNPFFWAPFILTGE